MANSNTKKSISDLWEDLGTQPLNGKDEIQAWRSIYDGFLNPNDNERQADAVIQIDAGMPKINYHRTVGNLLTTRILKDPLSISIVNAGEDAEAESNTLKVQHLINAIWNANKGEEVKVNFVEDSLVDGYSSLFFEARPKRVNVNLQDKRVEFGLKTVSRRDVKYYYNSPDRCIIHRELISKSDILSYYSPVHPIGYQNMELSEEQKANLQEKQKQLEDVLDTKEPEKYTYDSIYILTKYTKDNGIRKKRYSFTTVIEDSSNSSDLANEDYVLESGSISASPFSFFSPILEKLNGVGVSIILRNAPLIKNINNIFSNFEEANEVLGQIIIECDPTSLETIDGLRDKKGYKNIMTIPRTVAGSINVIKPDLYNKTTLEFYEMVVRLLFKTNGVTEQAVQGEKPKGLRTGKAIRESTNLEQSTYLTMINRYKQCYTSFNTNMLVLIDDLMTVHYSDYKVSVFHESSEYSTIDWKKINYKKNMYSMQIEPISKLADTPEGRVEFISELSKISNVSSQQLTHYLAVPDLKKLTEDIVSRDKAVDEVIESFIAGDISEASVGIDGQVQYDRARLMYIKELGKPKRDDTRINKIYEYIKLTKELRDQELAENLELQQGQPSKNLT